MTVKFRTESDSPRPRLDTVVNAATTGRLCFCESVDELGVANVAELPVAIEGKEEEVAIVGVLLTTTAGITCELSYTYDTVSIVLFGLNSSVGAMGATTVPPNGPRSPSDCLPTTEVK